MHFSDFVMPLMILLVLVSGLFRHINLFSAFLDGAKKGLQTMFSILPSIVGLVCAVSMLRASGAITLLCNGLSTITNKIGFPSEVLPLVFFRPISGSASLAVLKDILSDCGPDSFAGMVASVISGSTETTFYTLTVYFAVTRAKDTRHTLKSALLADFTGFLLGAVAVRFMLSFFNG